MNVMLDELKSTVSGLPVSERAELAHFLLDTLETPDKAFANEEIAAGWLALAEKRIAEMEAGLVVDIPAEQVLQDLRKRLS